MFSQTMVITETGMTVLVRAAGGEQFTFTKFQVGSGIMAEGETKKTMTALKNVVLGNIGITQADDTAEEGYIELTGSFNTQTDVQSAFLWTEIGLIAEDEDGNEYLYAYGYDNTSAESVVPAAGGVTMEQRISAVIAIGESENITVNVLPASTYASQADFQAHVENQQNPHGVTRQQVGAAAESHTHNATEIINGVLPVERGGTGVGSLERLKQLVFPGFAVGEYVGDGTQRMDVTLGFMPDVVILISTVARYSLATQAPTSISFTRDRNYSYQDLYSTDSADTLFNRGYGGAAVTGTGFAVGYNADGCKGSNSNAHRYLYIAIKH